MNNFIPTIPGPAMPSSTSPGSPKGKGGSAINWLTVGISIGGSILIGWVIRRSTINGIRKMMLATLEMHERKKQIKWKSDTEPAPKTD